MSEAEQGQAHPFPLTEKERHELRDRLREANQEYEKHPVPPELTEQEKKERIKKIREKRKLAIAATATTNNV